MITTSGKRKILENALWAFTTNIGQGYGNIPGTGSWELLYHEGLFLVVKHVTGGYSYPFGSRYREYEDLSEILSAAIVGAISVSRPDLTILPYAPFRSLKDYTNPVELSN